MELIDKCVDYGDAPTILATAIGRIYYISRHIVRVTFVRTDVDDNGAEQLRVSGHVDWDVTDLKSSHAMFEQVIDEVLSTPPAKHGKQTHPASH